MGKETKNLLGLTFGRLTVISRAEPYKSNSGNLTRWLCKCTCGKEKIILASQLLANKTVSCGCQGRENRIKAIKKHGLSKTRIYHIYLGMLDRCYDKTSDGYKNYGARGIKICDEWLGINGVINFYTWANNNGYSDKLTIDRIDVNGNYEPQNCRWITLKKQQNNKRDNVFVVIDGEKHTIKEWSEITGINYTTIKNRIQNGWKGIDAVLTPVDIRFSHKKTINVGVI